ncbi:MAG: hypothetical protein V8R51_01200 [Clostridia bacterium]
MNKIVLHLQGFYIYCIEQFYILKLQILCKIHNTKLLNQTNEEIHIDETSSNLVLANNDIVRFKTKLWIKISVILKKVFVIIKLLISKIKANKHKGQKWNRPRMSQGQKRNRPRMSQGQKRNRP